MAAAWAVMNYLGDEGYCEIVREVMEATRLVIDGINGIDGVEVLGEPNMCMFAFASTSEKINVYRLADVLKKKGWYVQPQFARANSPANLHISMNRATVHQAQTFLHDLENAIEELKQEEISNEARELRAELDKLSIKFDDATFLKLTEMAGVTGTELPDKMETINQIMEVLPYDVSEWILIEYLNNLMVPATGECHG
jgi:glutamate/tyrosine decarboxylase-like PLP-dependent enzyme